LELIVISSVVFSYRSKSNDNLSFTDAVENANRQGITIAMFFFLNLSVSYFIFLLTNPGEGKKKRTAARSASTPAHSTVGLTRIKYANLRKIQGEREFPREVACPAFRSALKKKLM